MCVYLFAPSRGQLSVSPCKYFMCNKILFVSSSISKYAKFQHSSSIVFSLYVSQANTFNPFILGPEERNFSLFRFFL